MRGTVTGVLVSAVLHLALVAVLLGGNSPELTQQPSVEVIELNLSLFDVEQASPDHAQKDADVSVEPPDAAIEPLPEMPLDNLPETPVAPAAVIATNDLTEPQPEPEPLVSAEGDPRAVQELPSMPLEQEVPEEVEGAHVDEVTFVESVVEPRIEPVKLTEHESVPVRKPDQVAPAEVSAVASTTADSVEESNYSGKVRAAVVAQRVYPRQARRRQITGEVRVGFTLQNNGRLMAADIVRSSGVAVLDDAALAAVSRVRQFDAFPATVTRTEWDFEVVLVFR